MVSLKPRYRFLYLAAFLLALHYAFTIYINSSYLLNFFDGGTISHLYMIGSLFTIACLVVSSRFLKWFGNYFLILTGLFFEAIALTTLAFSTTPAIIALAFIVHQALPPMLLFGMDIFFEGTLVSMRDAEKVRSYYLTFGNIAFVVAPLTVGTLIAHGSFKIVYILSATFIGVLWVLIADVFRHVKPRRYRETSFKHSLKKFLERNKLSGIFAMNFTLQCFYALMVIFTAPYLHNVIGISWESIGFIYTIMLLPFILFEAPLGKIFDRLHDERDVLIAGFLIMALSVFFMAFVHTPNILLWAGLLFMSRVGASFVEVANEASFFRRVTDQDASFIGIFRLSGPLSYVIAPTIASIFIPVISISTLYLLISAMLLGGVALAYKISL